MNYCLFCEIVTDDPYEQIEMATKNVIVITPLKPVVEGHKLVISKRHANDAAELPSVTAWTMRDAARIVQRLGQDCNIITSVGPAATQTVFHLHIHIVPRSPGDGLALPWTSA